MEKVIASYYRETSFPLGQTVKPKTSPLSLSHSQKRKNPQQISSTILQTSRQTAHCVKRSRTSKDGTVANQVYKQDYKPRLTFRGGKVLKHPKFVSIYLGQFWQTIKGKAMKAYNDKFARSLFKSRHMDIWKEYGVGKGTFLSSEVVTPATASHTINDNQIQRLVQKEIDAGRVPKENGETVYSVYLPPDMVLKAPGDGSSLDGIGGYHMSYNTDDGKKVYYSAIVFSQGQNGIDFNGKPQDNISIVSSHEWSEAATDPDVNNGKLGWYNDEYGEIGDIPINIGMPLRDVYGRINGYAVQKEWSNKDGKAELIPAGVTAQ